MIQRWMLHRTLALGALLLFLTTAAQAQDAPTLSTPIPSTATFRIAPSPIQADGSKFLLLVDLGGGATLKYVARREDLQTRLRKQFDLVVAANKREHAANRALLNGADEVEQETRDLQRTQRELQQQLTDSSQTVMLMLGKVQPRPTPTPAPSPSPAPSPAPAPAAVEAIAKGSEVAANPSRVAAIEASGPHSAEDVVARTDPEQQGLLSLPFDPTNITVTLNKAASAADGSKLDLSVLVGGMPLHYTANREDWAIFQSNGLSFAQAAGDEIRAEGETIRALVARLEERRNLVSANVADLQEGLRISKQNTDMLALIIKSQKRSKWERIIEQIPSIAGIIALAITSR
ncbi:MAG TPA: hypothetical protein VF735_02280 [Pyrinomonadaceae bacterium]|jgi:hypothetical protein